MDEIRRDYPNGIGKRSFVEFGNYRSLCIRNHEGKTDGVKIRLENDDPSMMRDYDLYQKYNGTKRNNGI